MKKERIKRRMYAYRQETKSGFFDHIDRFYDSVRLLLNNFKREVVLCLQKWTKSWLIYVIHIKIGKYSVVG